MTDRRRSTESDAGTGRVVCAGMGNLGSHLAVHVVRAGGIRVLTLIDHDTCEAKNLSSQAMRRTDVGKSKVAVQRRQLLAVDDRLEIRALRSRVEDVPLGLLHAEAILAGFDSRAARRYVNQAAWRLGVPWIDAAVDATGLLLRVSVFVPGDDAPCLECGWDDDDYAAQEQVYPCGGTHAETSATGAPSALGAVAAGIMALEYEKLRAGQRDHLLAGREVLIDLRHHTHYLTNLRRNTRCRFDHRRWGISRLPGAVAGMSARRLFEVVGQQMGETHGWCIAVEGHRFAQQFFCPGCGRLTDQRANLVRRVRRPRCALCGEPTVVRGTELCEWLDAAALEEERRRTLASMGFRAGDVLTVRNSQEERHFKLD